MNPFKKLFRFFLRRRLLKQLKYWTLLYIGNAEEAEIWRNKIIWKDPLNSTWQGTPTNVLNHGIDMGQGSNTLNFILDHCHNEFVIGFVQNLLPEAKIKVIK